MIQFIESQDAPHVKRLTLSEQSNLHLKTLLGKNDDNTLFNPSDTTMLLDLFER